MDATSRRAREPSAERELAKCELVTYSVMGREVRASWLTELGFQHVRRYYRMEILLNTADASLRVDPEFPAGASIERVGVAEAIQREYHAVMSEAFTEHWGHVSTDFETWLAGTPPVPTSTGTRFGWCASTGHPPPV